MGQYALCVVLLCAFAFGYGLGRSNQTKIDTYVDQIVADANKQVVDNKLEPLHLKNFTFKIAKTGISNRDVKANITFGRFEGVSKLRRRGSCRLTVPPLPKGRSDLAPVANITINCNVTFSGVKALVTHGEYKGDTLSGTLKKFSTVTNIDSADMNVTFVGRSGLKGHLSLTVLDRVVLSTEFVNAKERPDLNKQRLKNFTDELNNRLAVQIFDFASDKYKKFLENATSRKILPYLV
ncbi:hypothetical protein BIW11_05519 [Tropilaelaps mercedesae]|uniref:Uncharacterized protein n=1 Tax=Tropilaelaps mercedesae TaxID=418985 RepID=A0A1V9Y1X6_9ACAR|nr:hypothetical protein BIW11_05519 [Tropilaelaps mercedesae]